MGLAIAICFFLTSFCVIKFTNNDYSIAQYNKILAINTTALSAVVIALSENLNLASLAFPVLAILFVEIPLLQQSTSTTEIWLGGDVYK